MNRPSTPPIRAGSASPSRRSITEAEWKRCLARCARRLEAATLRREAEELAAQDRNPAAADAPPAQEPEHGNPPATVGRGKRDSDE